MKINKVTFKNRDGVELSGRLELPASATTQAYALFAHCFTCTKNLKSVHDISAALGQNGIAVFAFDFTGLGESEGDFAETNFSSSVNDLIDAAKFLQSEYQAPAILIGHSLGGTAAIRAALEIPSVLAVATIGAPFCPAHVKNLFADDIDSIRADGETQVHIGGRSFRIRRQFLDDINGQSVESALRNLKRALLVFHSPLDNVVGIENATNIFQ
ncbi:MAG: alpha/beta fold hydrolase, partial [Leptospiraceae bacterium]|nr:alpha/beta fold hydrolase [Leptospiraceae bacterium]